MRIRNLTPHAIILVGPNNESVTLPPDPEGPARVSISREPDGEVQIDGVSWPVRISRTVVSAPANLPPRQDGVLLLVARAVAEAAPERDDLVIVDETIRDEKGRIVGARALARLVLY